VSSISEHLSRITVENGVSRTKVKNAPKQIKLTVAVASETSVNVVLKSPKVGYFDMFLIYTQMMVVLLTLYNWFLFYCD